MLIWATLTRPQQLFCFYIKVEDLRFFQLAIQRIYSLHQKSKSVYLWQNLLSPKFLELEQQD
ncbi:hypothetical protein NIES25_51730 [Nostoc linckia NIES-25]|nr:hypothetical protein NIES25_05830 [Nostoc linckia NIES-25]BAY78697.1 hypothetical protein NIES25_51730 [Nostoc linckia NIES-25]